MKDIRLPYNMMYDLLMQRDVRLKREARFASCNPRQRQSGWTLFLSDFSKQRSESAAERDPTIDGLRAAHSLLKQASDAWKQMGKEQRLAYNQRAKQMFKDKTALKDQDD